MTAFLKAVIRNPLIGGSLLATAKQFSRLSRWLAYHAHRFQMFVEWKCLPNPEWFDHNMDLYYQWTRLRNPVFVERGGYNVLALKAGGRILDLCCGDGFNAYYFYSNLAREVISVDFDAQAIAHANRNYRADNVTYRIADIRSQMPEGPFDNVLWDAAIANFTPDEITSILTGIRDRLTPGGILSGCTIVERQDGQKSMHQHEYEFKSKEELADLLFRFFPNVRVFETVYASRHNLYFYASDGVIPFSPEWGQAALRQRQPAESPV